VICHGASDYLDATDTTSTAPEATSSSLSPPWAAATGRATARLDQPTLTEHHPGAERPPTGPHRRLQHREPHHGHVQQTDNHQSGSPESTRRRQPPAAGASRGPVKIKRWLKTSLQEASRRRPLRGRAHALRPDGHARTPRREDFIDGEQGRTSENEAVTIASPASARRCFRRSTPNRYAARHRGGNGRKP
jgi:hypothetical protein